MPDHNHFASLIWQIADLLRGPYRPSNRMGQNIRWALEDRRKVLLTATPLQNSLVELYGLSMFIEKMRAAQRAATMIPTGGK